MRLSSGARRMFILSNDRLALNSKNDSSSPSTADGPKVYAAAG